MKTEDKAIVTEVTRLRSQGLVESATGKMNALLQQCPVERLGADALAEGIKLSLLNEQSDTAYALYQRLCSLPDAASHWDLEWLARLSLLTGRDIPETHSIQNSELGTNSGLRTQDSGLIIQGKTHSRWVELYLQDGADPLYPVGIEGVALRCPQEAAVYTFVTLCASCNVGYQFSIAMTLAVEREFYCPNCFARQRVNYESIRDYLVRSRPPFLTEQINRLDSGANAIHLQLFSEALYEEKAPLLARYLGQDYVVLLNQFMLERLSRQPEGRLQ